MNTDVHAFCLLRDAIILSVMIVMARQHFPIMKLEAVQAYNLSKMLIGVMLMITGVDIVTTLF